MDRELNEWSSQGGSTIRILAKILTDCGNGDLANKFVHAYIY